MKLIYRFSLFVLLYLGITALCYSQDKKGFRIDERKILLNENLDFFVAKLKSEKFTILKRKKEIPPFIKSQLLYFNDKSIANPDEEYQETDVIFKTLPYRKLVFLAKSSDVLIIIYLKGGVGTTSQMAFISYKGNKILDLWSGYGCFNCKSVKDVLNYIKANRNKQWGLNTNVVDL